MAEPLRRRVRARALDGLTRLSVITPRPLVQAGLGTAAGLARWSRFEKITRANLELALGSETSAAERAQIARGVRRHSARLVREWLQLAGGALSERARAEQQRWITAIVELDPSVEILESVAARGRGVIVVTGHLGNWELLAARLYQRGYRGNVVGLRKHRDSSADWLERMRRAYGVETLPQGLWPRDLLQVLRRGDTLGLLCDLEVRRLDGEFLPFFGVPALTMTAPAAYSRAARTPLVPVRCVLRGERYVLSVEEPLEYDSKLDKAAARRDLAARTNEVLERWIRETPEQWAWHQRRWRTREGERVAIPYAGRRAGVTPERTR